MFPLGAKYGSKTVSYHSVYNILVQQNGNLFANQNGDIGCPAEVKLTNMIHYTSYLVRGIAGRGDHSNSVLS